MVTFLSTEHICMRTWWLPVDKKRQQATQALSKKDENLKHIGVFQVALFEGFRNIPHIPLPPEHSVDTNEATMAPTPQKPPCWHNSACPQEMCIRLQELTATIPRPSTLNSNWKPPIISMPLHFLLIAVASDRRPFPLCDELKSTASAW